MIPPTQPSLCHRPAKRINGHVHNQNGGSLTVGTSGRPTRFLDVGRNTANDADSTSQRQLQRLGPARCRALRRRSDGNCNNGVNPYTGAAGNGTVNLSGGSLSVSVYTTVKLWRRPQGGRCGTGHVHIRRRLKRSQLAWTRIGRNGGTGTIPLPIHQPDDNDGPLIGGALAGGTGELDQSGGTVTVSADSRDHW